MQPITLSDFVWQTLRILLLGFLVYKANIQIAKWNGINFQMAVAANVPTWTWKLGTLSVLLGFAAYSMIMQTFTSIMHLIFGMEPFGL